MNNKISLNRNMLKKITIFVRNKITFKTNAKMNENIKSLSVAIIATIASIINPIHNVLVVLSATFLFNIWIGISADKIVNNANFSIKKAFSAFTQMAITMVFVYYSHIVFEQLGMDKFGHEVIKWIALLAVYFYSTNIVRNLSDIFPRNKLFSFGYSVLTTQIFSLLKNSLISSFRGGGDDKQENKDKKKED